jgi:hypothetical protein
MRSLAAVFLLAALVLPSVAAAAQPKLTGSWEAVRNPDDERVYLVLKDLGKAEIVAEYDFSLPGQPGKRRGRSTTFGHWTMKGNEVVVTYAKIEDRLRYVDQEPLSVVGLSGTSPALKPVGKANAKSKLGSLVLWKAPHDYRAARPAEMPAAGSAAAPASPAVGAASEK